MLKLPNDKHGNEGWAVRARKAHRCEWHGAGCRGIAPGDWYYRAVAWPRTDVNNGSVPWIMRLCRDCLPTDERRAVFDVITNGFATAADYATDREVRSSATGRRG